MTEFIVYVFLILCFSISISFSVLYLKGWKMVISIVALLMFSFLSIIYNFYLLGKPNYTNFITKIIYDFKEVDVLWSAVDKQNKIIHVMILPNNSNSPIYFILPWNQQTAEKMEESNEKDRKGQGGKMKLKNPTSDYIPPENVTVVPQFVPIPKTIPKQETIELN